MPEPTIRTTGLTKTYFDRTVVNNLNLEVQAGEVFGLLGPNGAGKTTTILMLLGLTEPSAGRVEVLGMDPARQPLQVKARVGYLPDAVGFYEGLSGRQNLRYTARLNRIESDETEARIESVLADVGLVEVADRLAGVYSRGMRQRLGIADALLKKPGILILDEPTASIDPEGVAEILTLIRRLADDQGVTILLSSHLLHQVQAICDRVAIFVAGNVVAQGRTHELAAAGKGPEHLEVGVDADATSVRRVLGEVGSVVSVNPSRSQPRVWSVAVERGRTSEVVAKLVTAGLPVWMVKRTSDELDEVYRQYFHETEAKVS